MNSSFPVLPGAGGGAQAGGAAEPFLGQISLYPSGYTDHPLRHYPGAAAVAYGAGGGTVHQDRPHPATSFYQQAAGVGAGGAGAAACDYAAAAAAAAASFYRDKEHACSMDEHQLALSQDGVHRKMECAGLGGKGVFGEAMEDKPASTPIYPWMQRMNACNGEFSAVCLLRISFCACPLPQRVFIVPFVGLSLTGGSAVLLSVIKRFVLD